MTFKSAATGGRAPLPPPGARPVSSLVVVDRAVDLLSPACTQLTYEGLIDEVFGITNGAVMLDPGGCRRAPCGSGPASCITRTTAT